MNDREDAQKQKQAGERGVAVNPSEHLTPAPPATAAPGDAALEFLDLEAVNRLQQSLQVRAHQPD